jgi:hypothetical protein
MIEFLGEQLEQWRKDEQPLDFAADDISSIAGKVKA